MKALSFLIGIFGLGLAGYIFFTGPGGGTSAEQIARINQDLTFDLSYCETGVIGQTESACKAEARAEHARRLNSLNGFTNAIPLGIGGISLLFFLYGIFGKSGKKNQSQPAYGAPQQPSQAYYQPPQQQPKAASASSSLESKLAELSALKASGKITEDEYKEMRQNLLSKF